VEHLTNQTVAVGVLMMILGGLGWIFKQIFSMLPTLLDRLDRQEDKRSEAIKGLADRFEKSNDAMITRIEMSNRELGDRFEKSNESMIEYFQKTMVSLVNDIEDCLEIEVPANGKGRNAVEVKK
jgi:predicted PurR-regulated permease PerM